MSIWLWTSVGVAASAPLDGGPDVIVASSCSIDAVGFVDVDADGTDDLTLQLADRVVSWPSTNLDAHDATVWRIPNAGIADGHAEMTSGRWGGPAQLLWAQGGPDSELFTAEYVVDSQSLTLTSEWSESRWDWYSYLGDVDGDGISDPFDGGYYRLSSSGEWILGFLDWFDVDGVRFNGDYYAPVGDLNGDGYDDVVVGWRAWDSGASKCGSRRGPAQLHFGSPAGLLAVPVWQIWAPGAAELAVGQQVVSIPEHDTLIVTMMTESVFCYDWTAMSLGVIRNASTSGAYLDQVVSVPEFGSEDGFYSYLFGLLPGPAGGQALAILDATGWGQGIHWFSWDSDSGRISEKPVADWSTLRPLDLYTTYLAIPTGRRAQALVHERLVEDGPNELLVWGRTIDDVGPTRNGSAAGDCTFWSAEPDVSTPTGAPLPPTIPTEDDDAGGAEAGSEVPGAVRGCGCELAPGGGLFGGLAVASLLASLLRTRLR